MKGTIIVVTVFSVGRHHIEPYQQLRLWHLHVSVTPQFLVVRSVVRGWTVSTAIVHVTKCNLVDGLQAGGTSETFLDNGSSPLCFCAP